MRGLTFQAAVVRPLAMFVVVLLLATGVPVRSAEPSVETPSSKLADNPGKRSDLHNSLRERSIGQFEQMSQIFMASREGKLNQKEMQEKLTKSFARHRKEFVNILNSQQRGKLELWEKERSAKKRQILTLFWN